MSPNKRKSKKGFWHNHSLSIVCGGILILWIVLYSVSKDSTHWGSFFGNAIADWTGVIVTILATKHLYEKGSSESRNPLPSPFHGVREFVHEHSLTIFLVLTGVAWIVVYAEMNSESKWGQVVGNIVSEWTQLLGIVLITKKCIERYSKESKDPDAKDNDKENSQKQERIHFPRSEPKFKPK